MVKREDVEQLLRDARAIPSPVTIAACEAWLALDAAPVVDLGGQYLEAWDVFAQVPEFADGSGFIESGHQLANKRRVRLVATPTTPRASR